MKNGNHTHQKSVNLDVRISTKGELNIIIAGQHSNSGINVETVNTTK